MAKKKLQDAKIVLDLDFANAERAAKALVEQKEVRRKKKEKEELEKKKKEKEQQDQKDSKKKGTFVGRARQGFLGTVGKIAVASATFAAALETTQMAFSIGAGGLRGLDSEGESKTAEVLEYVVKKIGVLEALFFAVIPAMGDTLQLGKAAALMGVDVDPELAKEYARFFTVREAQGEAKEAMQAFVRERGAEFLVQMGLQMVDTGALDVLDKLNPIPDIIDAVKAAWSE
jgi:hypothetical protein